MTISFSQFNTLAKNAILTIEAYDADVMRTSTIKKQGEGGRVGRDRRKTEPEIRRVRAVGGGRTEPVIQKPRKDIGQQRKTETRVQQPTQERGSADVKAKAEAAAKEERRKAALARIAAKKSGGEAPAASKPTAKDAGKEATKLLSTKKEKQEPHPDYKPQKASGMTRAERDKARNAAKRALYNEKKAKLMADFKETHGRSPTAKERTKLLGLAHASINN